MKKLTSAVVASSLVLGLVGSAFAAPSTEQVNEAWTRLHTYGIVQGVEKPDGTVDPDLGATLTRAQLATILVRAFGGEETAKLLVGAKSFDDVAANEWYSGYVALLKNMAEKKGIVVGYEDGSFRPNQNVTAIEALAFVMKLLGVAPGTGANWVEDTIKNAKDAGVITDADVAAFLSAPSAPATRGLAFALADAIFATYEVAEGKTVYTSYVDTVAPVLTISKAAEPTTTATTYTITGSVSGADKVYLGSDMIEVAEDGTFSVDVNLEVGANTFTFTAVDLAGNVTEASFEITRQPGAAAKVVASLSSETVKVGEEAELTIAVLDENGVELEVNAEDLKVTVGGEIGTYDAETGVFKAGTKAGTGTITVTYGDLTSEAVNVTVAPGDLAKVAVSAESVAKGDKVTLTATDEHGNAIEGVTFTVDKAEGIISGNTFVGTAAGTYTITATKDDKTATAKVGVYASAANVAFKSTISGLIANGASEAEVLVAVVDDNGNVVTTDTRNVTLTPSAAVEVAAYNYSTGTWGSFSTTAVSAAAKDGVAKFKVRAAATSVGQTLKVTASADFGTTPTTKTADLTFTTVAQVATSIKVDAPTYLPQGGAPGTLSISVLDQAEKPMVQFSGEWKGTVTLTGPATISNEGKFTYQGGSPVTLTVTPTAGYTGDVVATVTIDGLGAKTATMKAVYPTNVASLKLTAVDDKTSDKAGNALTLKVETLDANGVPIAPSSNKTLKVNIVDPNGNSVDLSSSTDVTEGGALNGNSNTFTLPAGTQNVTFTLAAIKAGTYKVSVEDTESGSGKLNASGTVSLTYSAADPAKVALNRTGVIYVPVSDPKATFEVQVKDNYDNNVAAADKVVEVRVTSGNASEIKINGTTASATTPVEVKTDASGKAVLNVEALPLGGIYTISADLKDVADTAATVNLNVATRVASSITLTAVSATTGNPITAATAGQQVYLRAVVKDQFGVEMNTLADVGLALANASEILWDGAKLTKDPGVVWAYDGTNKYFRLDNGGTEGVVTLGKAGLQTLTVKSNTSRDGLTANYSISIAPNTAANQAQVTLSNVTYDSNAGVYKLTLKKGTVSGPLTIQMTDLYGNPISVFGGTDISVNAGGASSPVAVRTAVDGANVASIPGVYSSQTVYVSLSDAATAGATYDITFTAASSGDTIILRVTAE